MWACDVAALILLSHRSGMVSSWDWANLSSMVSSWDWANLSSMVSSWDWANRSALFPSGRARALTLKLGCFFLRFFFFFACGEKCHRKLQLFPLELFHWISLVGDSLTVAYTHTYLIFISAVTHWLWHNTHIFDIYFSRGLWGEVICSSVRHQLPN